MLAVLMNAFWVPVERWFPFFVAVEDSTAVSDVVLVLSLICLAIGVVGLLIHRLNGPSCRTLVEDWCLDRQWRVERMERRYLWKGPFFFSGNGTTVYFVTARDALGYRKHFWARCGHGLFGMLVPEIRVVPAD